MEALILSALAVYGVTIIIIQSDGPWGLFYRLRKKSWLGALNCFLCLSVYVSALTALLTAGSISQWIIYTFGFSGAAILLYKLTED